MPVSSTFFFNFDLFCPFFLNLKNLFHGFSILFSSWVLSFNGKFLLISGDVPFGGDESGTVGEVGVVGSPIADVVLP